MAGCARHVGVGGRLVAGFQLDRGYGIEAYDEDCAAAGLDLAGAVGDLGPTAVV